MELEIKENLNLQSAIYNSHYFPTPEFAGKRIVTYNSFIDQWLSGKE
jgi:hypothetical protein